MKSYFECADYFLELSEYKIQQLESGETTEKGTMDLMGNLILLHIKVDSNINRPSCSSLSEQS